MLVKIPNVKKASTAPIPHPMFIYTTGSLDWSCIAHWQSRGLDRLHTLFVRVEGQKGKEGQYGYQSTQNSVRYLSLEVVHTLLGEWGHSRYHRWRVVVQFLDICVYQMSSITKRDCVSDTPACFCHMTECYQIAYEHWKNIRDKWQLTQRLWQLASPLKSIEIGPYSCQFCFSPYSRRQCTSMIRDCNPSSVISSVIWATNLQAADA